MLDFLSVLFLSLLTFPVKRMHCVSDCLKFHVNKTHCSNLGHRNGAGLLSTPLWHTCSTQDAWRIFGDPGQKDVVTQIGTSFPSSEGCDVQVLAPAKMGVAYAFIPTGRSHG